MTYVGELTGVELADGTYIAVERRALGIVDGLGLVSAPTRQDLAAGRYDRPPSDAVPWPLGRFEYYRQRPEGSRWYHDTPGAYVSFGHQQPPVAIVNSQGAYRCDRPGDFVCGV